MPQWLGKNRCKSLSLWYPRHGRKKTCITNKHIQFGNWTISFITSSESFSHEDMYHNRCWRQLIATQQRSIGEADCVMYTLETDSRQANHLPRRCVCRPSFYFIIMHTLRDIEESRLCDNGIFAYWEYICTLKHSNSVYCNHSPWKHRHIHHLYQSIMHTFDNI